MPEQFINVKHNNSDIQNFQPSQPSMITEMGKKQDCSWFGSTSNISNANSDICRICHCEADSGNPLLSPCYCSGSLKYVHQSCLQQWLAASDTRSCELCKFNFILHTKIKPIGEWRRLEMTGVEKRRLLCAILFHFVAAVCVIWSLFVLIDRAAEEVQKGVIAWPFWTKLVVVAVGFTGGAVFMYIQCRQYLQLFSRWKAHNRIILVQNAPEKIIAPPSPNFSITIHPNRIEPTSQVVANVECNVPPPRINNPIESSYIFDAPSTVGSTAQKSTNNQQQQQQQQQDNAKLYMETISSTSSLIKSDSSDASFKIIKLFSIVKDLADDNTSNNRVDNISVGKTSCDALELNIQEILALDMEYSKRHMSYVELPHTSKSTDSDHPHYSRNHQNNKVKCKYLFQSMPNLSASSENLLL